MTNLLRNLLNSLGVNTVENDEASFIAIVENKPCLVSASELDDAEAVADVMANAAPTPQMHVKPLEDGSYDIFYKDSDYHLRAEDGEFVLDEFDSKSLPWDDNDKAYIGTTTFNSVGEALGFILTGEH